MITAAIQPQMCVSQAAEFLGKGQKSSKWCIYSIANKQGSWLTPWEVRR